MSDTNRNVPIRQWESGDYVQGFALLTKKERRQDRNGRDYLDMELSDQTGNISGKVWSDSPALHGDYEQHDFVAFKGAVKSYRDQLQIAVEHCRRANDEDRRLGFDEALLTPSTPEDIDDLWMRLEGVLDTVEKEPLRLLSAVALERHGAALREHPAAKTMHHAYRGGLLEHTVSMMELAGKVCDHYRYLDRDLVLLGALFHDLGKIEELGAMPANDYTLPGRLVGHVIIGRDYLLEACAAVEGFPAELKLHLEHLVLSHQGKKEFSAPVEPMTAEALALHFVDDLDSKLNQLTEAKRHGDGDLQFLRGLGRYVFLGEMELESAGGGGESVQPSPEDLEPKDPEEGTDSPWPRDGV
jgi:3'-5' exoribonuclease